MSLVSCLTTSVGTRRPRLWWWRVEGGCGGSSGDDGQCPHAHTPHERRHGVSCNIHCSSVLCRVRIMYWSLSCCRCGGGAGDYSSDGDGGCVDEEEKDEEMDSVLLFDENTNSFQLYNEKEEVIH